MTRGIKLIRMHGATLKLDSARFSGKCTLAQCGKNHKVMCHNRNHQVTRLNGEPVPLGHRKGKWVLRLYYVNTTFS